MAPNFATITCSFGGVPWFHSFEQCGIYYGVTPIGKVDLVLEWNASGSHRRFCPRSAMFKYCKYL